MHCLARVLRRVSGPARGWGQQRLQRLGSGPCPPRGAGSWGWGVGLGLALGVNVAAGCEQEGAPWREPAGEVKPPPHRGFSRAIESSRDLLQRIKDEVAAPGIVIGVSVDGKEIWSEGLGYADVENRVLCKPETIMRIASISKCLTVMAVAKLWEEGKLDLDAPVQKYVPEFPEKEFEGEKVTITTRLLVSHLSGIRHYEKDITKVKEQKEKANKALKLIQDVKKSNQEKELKEKEDKDTEKNDFTKAKSEQDGEAKDRNLKPVKRTKEFEHEEYYLKEKFENVIDSLKIFKNDPLFFKPGSQFLYSTYGFTLLSAVVERASGCKFTDYMLKMFRDLDMLATVLDDNESMIYNRARCHSTASMEPVQFTAAVVSIVNTLDIILQYVQNLARRLHHGDDCEEDLNTDFPESTGCGNWDIMTAVGQVDKVEHQYWTQQTSTDWLDCIVLQVWDDSQCLRNFRMWKATFVELCELLSPALKLRNTKMRAARTVEK